MNGPTTTEDIEHVSRTFPTSECPLYSVVIPVYRSAPILPELIRQLDAFFDAHGLRREYVFVNDGSPDDSWQVLESLRGDRDDIVAIDMMRNYGQHSALFCGLEHSSGDFVITMDDDLQNPPEEIIHLIRKSEEGYDAVFGRFHQKMHGRGRGLGSKFIGWLNGRLFNKPPDLVLTNFRLLRREVVDAICEYRTAFPYLPGLVLMTARTFANVPVEHRPRAVGNSNYNPLTILRLVWRIVFNYSAFPIRLLCGIGGLAAFGAFGLGIYFIARNLLYGTHVPGWTSLAVLLSFHMGFMLLLFSVIGEYLARILVETSGRSAYRIRRRLPARGPIAR